MEGVEASLEYGSHHNNLDNIYVELNNQPSELLKTVNDLRVELQTVKEDNEIISRLAEKHKVVWNCFEKTFTCLDDKGERITVKGIPRKVFVRQISILQMKKVVRKGCKVFVVHIINNEHTWIKKISWNSMIFQSYKIYQMFS